MAIITQPPRPVISAYRPIQFEVLTTSDPLIAIVQNAVVKLYVKNQLITTFRVKSTETAPALFPPLVEYKFCIDVAERMRDLIAPFSNMPSVFVLDCPTQPVNNTDSISNFYLDITYELLNLSTGLIEPQPTVNDVTNEFWAANITRQDLEQMYLDEFTTKSILSRALTNSDKILNVGYFDNIFLSYLITPDNDGPNAYQIVTFDAAGGILGAAYGLLPFTPQVGEVVTINTGIANGLLCLNNVFESPSFNLLDPLLNSYTITIGTYYLGAWTGGFREVFKYNVTTKTLCCDNRKARLHWLNNLGGVDSFTFCSIKELRYKTTAVIAETALPWDKTSLTPHNPTNSSKFKTRTTDSLIYRLVSQNLSNKTAVWLSEMLGSVKVYLEVEQNILIPVIIKDTEQLINKETGKRNLELNIELSSCIIKQTI